ncbi:hypothetical protein ACWGK9_36760, partial [Streptomyces rubiginosohelvolus]
MKPEPEMPQEALMLDALTAGRPTAPAPGACDQPATELVPIASLVTSDSPRLAVYDAEHVEALAETHT